MNFDWLLQYDDIQTFQPVIAIYRRGNFVYQHWGFTLINWPLSYIHNLDKVSTLFKNLTTKCKCIIVCCSLLSISLAN